MSGPEWCCRAFDNALEEGTDAERLGAMIQHESYGGFTVSETLPPIAFCPWCGSRLREQG